MGIPTASIIGSGFLKQAEVIVKGLGVPLAIGVYPGAPMVDSEQDLERKVEEMLAPGLLQGLTGESPHVADAKAEPAPGQVVFSGTFDEVQEHFYRQLWTDGFPMGPPTGGRVRAVLPFTRPNPDGVSRLRAHAAPAAR